MAAPISARRMVNMVGAQVENRELDHWTPTEVLSAIDEAVQHLYLVEQDARREHELDVMDVVVNDERAAGRMTATGAEVQNLTEWLVPESVFRIRRIENTSGTGNRGSYPEIPQMKLEDKEETRDRRRMATWMWTRRGDLRTKIGFLGGMAGITSFRVWFIRRIPPLHYGIARTGLDGSAPPVEMASTAARIWFDVGVTGAGRLIEKAQVYVGAIVEFGSHPTLGSVHGVTDEVRCIDTGVNTLLTTPLVYAWLWQFDEILQHPSTLAALNCAGYQYSLVPQIGQEHHELVILMAAVKLAKTSGSVKNIEIIKAEATDLYSKFVDAVAARQDQTPDFIQVPHGGWS